MAKIMVQATVVFQYEVDPDTFGDDGTTTEGQIWADLQQMTDYPQDISNFAHNLLSVTLSSGDFTRTAIKES